MSKFFVSFRLKNEYWKELADSSDDRSEDKVATTYDTIRQLFQMHGYQRSYDCLYEPLDSYEIKNPLAVLYKLQNTLIQHYGGKIQHLEILEVDSVSKII